MKRLVSEHFLHTGQPKRTFRSAQGAFDFIKLKGMKNMKVYKCKFCKCYHIATIK